MRQTSGGIYPPCHSLTTSFLPCTPASNKPLFFSFPSNKQEQGLGFQPTLPQLGPTSGGASNPSAAPPRPDSPSLQPHRTSPPRRPQPGNAHPTSLHLLPRSSLPPLSRTMFWTTPFFLKFLSVELDLVHAMCLYVSNACCGCELCRLLAMGCMLSVYIYVQWSLPARCLCECLLSSLSIFSLIFD